MTSIAKANRVSLTGVFALASIACGNPGAEFSEWTFSLPEDAPIKEYLASTAEGAPDIQLLEDLVIGGNTSDPRAAFGNLLDVAVDVQGNIYAIDFRGNHVQVFDPSGNFLRSLGAKGEGPGEFSGPTEAANVGRWIGIGSNQLSRISLWDLSGEYQGNLPLPMRPVTPVFGTEAGGLVAARRETTFDSEGVESSRLLISAFSATGEFAFDYLDFLLAPRPADKRPSPFSARPTYVATPAGDVYFTPREQYQILAVSKEGSVRWVLRAAAEREPVAEADWLIKMIRSYVRSGQRIQLIEETSLNISSSDRSRAPVHRL